MQQFISFLGQIGIDINLLIAQIVNFTILLWILNKFVYRSIVKRIEDDEKNLQKAKILEDSLAVEKNKFLKQKKDEMTKTKKMSRESIEEAGKLAEEIKKQAKDEAQKEMALMLSQMKKQVSSRQANLKNEQLQNLKERILKKVTEITKKISGTSDDVAEKLQDYFLGDIEEKLEGFPGETFQNPDPVIILETVQPLSTVQKEKVATIISKKFNRQVELNEKKSDSLIIGYRLEINGISVEHNLLNELLHATETVE